ncbi:porin family protein [Vibrio hangzhouensis]|uniref:Opacity protein n=1 Tax=Vibrio hangzhouensis TaxID=462991 RepID=A0A1H5ZM33_9VIBR|nr:porin family protein [Vibrio hangzhouensis]SEG36426.1 Opacity protein [Vibrio hangzhouensis]
MKLKHKLILLSTSLFALPALAQGFYAGASIGYGNQQNLFDDLGSGTGYLMAGYRINDNIGAEYRFGGVNASNSEINPKSYNSLLLRASYELEQNFEIYGLVGITQANGYFWNKQTHVTSPSVGLGVRYEISDGLGVNAEYVSVVSARDYSLSAAYFGIDYRF